MAQVAPHVEEDLEMPSFRRTNILVGLSRWKVEKRQMIEDSAQGRETGMHASGGHHRYFLTSPANSGRRSVR